MNYDIEKGNLMLVAQKQCLPQQRQSNENETCPHGRSWGSIDVVKLC